MPENWSLPPGPRRRTSKLEVGEVDPWTWNDVTEDPTVAHAPQVDLGPQMATSRQLIEMRSVFEEVADRKRESLRLYRPYPEQESFHASLATYRLARGGNRGGKTLAFGVEFARALTRQDPYRKYPDKGRAIAAGKDLLDISKVIYRKLFKPGAIKIIRDELTRDWRAYDPRTDLHRKDESEDAPPLIPQRFYDPRKISWEDKKEEIPRTIKLYTDWELTFFSVNA